MTVRDPGALDLAELQRLVGELVLTNHAASLRMAELEAALAAAAPPTPAPNGVAEIPAHLPVEQGR